MKLRATQKFVKNVHILSKFFSRANSIQTAVFNIGTVEGTSSFLAKIVRLVSAIISARNIDITIVQQGRAATVGLVLFFVTAKLHKILISFILDIKYGVLPVWDCITASSFYRPSIQTAIVWCFGRKVQVFIRIDDAELSRLFLFIEPRVEAFATNPVYYRFSFIT